jgi:hypothetical protein
MASMGWTKLRTMGLGISHLYLQKALGYAVHLLNLVKHVRLGWG